MFKYMAESNTSARKTGDDNITNFHGL